MMSRRFQFWWRWLIAVTATMQGLGLGMVLLPGPTQQVFNLLMFGSIQGNPTYGEASLPYIMLVYAVLGATLFGWGIALLLILWGPFRRGESEGWCMMTFSALAWFVPDTAYSLLSGFWPNAVLNLSFGIAFAIPLALTYPYFYSPETRKTLKL